MKILVINGPNLNLLGIREPDIYGRQTYCELVAFVEKTANVGSMASAFDGLKL